MRERFHPEDLNLFKFVDTPEDAFTFLRDGLTEYRLGRFAEEGERGSPADREDAAIVSVSWPRHLQIQYPVRVLIMKDDVGVVAAFCTTSPIARVSPETRTRVAVVCSIRSRGKAAGQE